MNRSHFAHEIRPDVVEVKCVADVRSLVGESPVWSARERCVYFVDILGCLVHRYQPEDRSLRSFPAPELVTAIAPRRGGGLVASLERRNAFFDPATEKFDVVRTMENELAGNRFNDGRVDRENAVGWRRALGDSAPGPLAELTS